MSEQPEPDARPVAAVVILAAGEGKRMKSARSKLLHEVAGHSLLSYAVTRRHQPAARAHRGRGRPPARPGRGPPGRDRAARDRPRCRSSSWAPGTRSRCALDALGELDRRGGRHLRRRADAGQRDPGRRCWPSTAASRPRSPCSPPRCPTRPATGGSCATPTARSQAIVEHRDADEAQRAITEINSGIYVFEAETLRAGLAELTPDQRPGRALPDRRARVWPAATAGRSRALIDRRPVADRGRQRPGPAVGDERRDEPPDPAAAGCGRGVTVIDPATHLGARLGRPRAGRHAAAGHLAGGRDLGRRRRDHRPRHHADRRRGGGGRHGGPDPRRR